MKASMRQAVEVMLGLLLAVTLTAAAPARTKRDLWDELADNFMDDEDIDDWEDRLAEKMKLLQEDILKMRSKVDNKIEKLTNEYNLEDLPPNYSKTFGKVEDKDGSKVMTNTTIEKQSNDKGEAALIKEVKTSQGKNGQGMQVVVQSSFSNIGNKPHESPVLEHEEGKEDNEDQVDEDNEQNI